ncbi:50S ribosomal protein L9 [Geomonas sp. Red32]|uniref:50S ribosomal protein L9 n=1 Tax=Geomonas sp. Red32 TaxID=2912856 RepID=UPI00202CAAB7|nr:50S ribosomal protein L9 [Geomonas sp. Red32]MCM0084276.1 50S ribosomal protein L9 [Geomonas sp. Red32]
MKVILKENVENLGHIGDIVKVAPGYARNYLLPKGFAIEATEKNAKALEHAKRQLEYKKNRVLEAAKQLSAKIEGLSLSIAHQAGADDKLFGAVTNMELAELLKAQGLEIDRKKIVLDEPIKHLGDFTAQVKIHPEVSATLKISITKA